MRTRELEEKAGGQEVRKADEIQPGSRQRNPQGQLPTRPARALARAQAQLLNQTVASQPSDVAGSLIQLQRTYGNRYVQRVVDLALETGRRGEVTPEIEAAIERSRGSGQPLRSGVRAKMQSAFGVDFSGVRVHNDSEADVLNQELGSRAFTSEQDIFFSMGEYNPDTSAGRKLLAHELTHVLQQRGSRRQGRLISSQPGDHCEEDAERVSEVVSRRLESGAYEATASSELTEKGALPQVSTEGQEVLRSEGRRAHDELAVEPDSRGPMIHHKCACGGTCSHCRSGMAQEEQHGARSTVQRTCSGHASEGSISETKQSKRLRSIQAQLGSGHSLDGGVGPPMASVLGYDFSSVRVHTDAKAAELASSYSARAFTVGTHIAFGAGEYKPGTPVGDALIAHELVHVVQQERGATASRTTHDGEGEQVHLEEDAQLSTAGVLFSLWSRAKGVVADIAGNLTPRLTSGLRLQRCTKGPQCACAKDLDVKTSGAIEGQYGISDYWPGVTSYWGGDKTLGQFDTASGAAHTLGHKFQVVGQVSQGKSSSGAGGQATFQQMARLTVGNNKTTATAGSWFDDMDYTDAWGGAHHWDLNAEVGTTGSKGYQGVRRTIAADKVAYTDPPAIGYTTGVTNTYRKLEFKIYFRSSPGCTCSKTEITRELTQEIEVTNGVPNVLTWG